MNAYIVNSMIELDILYSISASNKFLTSPKAEVNLSKSFTNLASSCSQVCMVRPSTQCMVKVSPASPASPAPGQRIQSFLALWAASGRSDCKMCQDFQDFAEPFQTLLVMKTAPDEVAPDRFCFPKANMVLPARASKILGLISQGRAKASSGFHGCSKTSTFSPEAFGDNPCKAPSDLGSKT